MAWEAFEAASTELTKIQSPEKSGLYCADAAGATNKARMHDARRIRMVTALILFRHRGLSRPAASSGDGRR